MKEPSELPTEVTSYANRGLGRKAMDLYFRPKRIEKWKNGRLYELLGIKIFKKVLVHIGRTFGWDSYFIGDGGHEGLKAYEKRTRISEAIHGPIAILLTYEIISLLVEGRYVGAVIIGPLWFLNALPAALQRYNRVRVESVLERKASRKVA